MPPSPPRCSPTPSVRSRRSAITAPKSKRPPPRRSPPSTSSPRFSWRGFVATYGDLYDTHGDLLTPYVRRAIETGRKVDAVTVVRAYAHLERFRAQMRDFFRRYDLLITPATAVPPFPHGVFVKEIEGKPALRFWGATPFSVAFNLTLQPAASIPSGWTADGLPHRPPDRGPLRRREHRAPRRRRPGRVAPLGRSLPASRLRHLAPPPHLLDHRLPPDTITPCQISRSTPTSSAPATFAAWPGKTSPLRWSSASAAPTPPISCAAPPSPPRSDGTGSPSPPGGPPPSGGGRRPRQPPLLAGPLRERHRRTARYGGGRDRRWPGPLAPALLRRGRLATGRRHQHHRQSQPRPLQRRQVAGGSGPAAFARGHSRGRRARPIQRLRARPRRLGRAGSQTRLSRPPPPSFRHRPAPHGRRRSGQRGRHPHRPRCPARHRLPGDRPSTPNCSTASPTTSPTPRSRPA